MNMDRGGECGFTLIEIIIVLVLLGILAATAVPKYFDLQKSARLQAANSAVAELEARINLVFGQELLKGATCAAAKITAVDTKNPAGSDVGNGWVINFAGTGASDKLTGLSAVPPTSVDTAQEPIAPSVTTFDLPKCDTDTTNP